VRNLTTEQRKTCRRALGEELRSEAQTIAQLDFDPVGEEPIGIHYDLALNDARHGWLTAIFEGHERQLHAFQANDFTDERWVGRSLRKRAGEHLRNTAALAELVAFLGEFDEDSVPGLYWAWGVSLVTRSALSALLCSETDANEVLRLQAELAAVEDDSEIRQLGDEVRSLSSEPHDPTMTEEEILEAALGERPTQRVEPSAPTRSFPGPRSRWVQLGFRQLRLIADTLSIPDSHAGTYLGLDCRLGSSMFPLVAHRSAYLTGELVFRAVVTDSSQTAELLVEFMSQQAGRIQTSGDRYHDLIKSVLDNPDTEELPEAYRTLAEGILRPYGSLIVSLEQVARGDRVSFETFGTLGEVEDALAKVAGPLATLSDLGMSRELRNFDAHEDIVRTETGDLAAVDAGQTQPIDIDDLLSRTLVLRSFLDGVDIAINVAFAALSVPTQSFPRDVSRTESLLQSIARFAAAELTDGMVERMTIREGEAVIEFRGPSTPVQLGLLTAAIRRQSAALGRIQIMSQEGEVLLEDVPSQ
jgi:hypothetical protein